LNSQEDAATASKLEASGAYSSGVKYQTFPRCAECHYKQFNFWRKTKHAQALEPLIDKQQTKNKECLTCHTLGLGDSQGFSNVNVLAEYISLKAPAKDSSKEGDAEKSPVAASGEDAKPQPMAIEDLSFFLKAMADKKSGHDSVKLIHSDPDGKSLPMQEAMHSLVKAWTPVQCENCHKPGKDHPLSDGYSKKVETDTCLQCHTAERAPDWYSSQGKPKMDLILEKRKLVSCPAGDTSDSEDP
jgi:hypothetical protein